jgi:hypothetical protein
MFKRLISLTILLIVCVSISYSQDFPGIFKLNGKGSVKASNDISPGGNSIGDMLVIGDTIWVAASKGLNVSFDRGETWKNFYNTEVLGTEDISAMGYDTTKRTFWIATAHTAYINGDAVDEGSGLHFTTDNGNTWTNIPQPIDVESDSLIVYGINDGIGLPKVRALPITVTPQNITYDIAFTPGNIWITSWSSGLRRSSDMGKTWQRVLLPSDNLNSLKPTDTVNFSLQVQSGKFGPEAYLNHVAFSVISTDDSTLYVGTADGINKTTDANNIYPSWQKFNHQNQDNPISGNFVVALGYNNVNRTVWGATWVAEDQDEFYGVSSTTDEGNTWNTFLSGEKVHNFGFKGADIIALSDDGAFRTSDQGSSWILPNAIIDKTTNLSLTEKGFISAASQGNDVWLGSNDGFARISESGNIMWVGDWKIFFSSPKLNSSLETYAYPNPFSPKLDRLKIKYSTGGKSANVTIRIFDFGMNLVRTVIENVQRGVSTHEIDNASLNGNGVIDFWNGKDENGNIVSNGVYFYMVEVDNDNKSYGKILVIQ